MFSHWWYSVRLSDRLTPGFTLTDSPLYWRRRSVEPLAWIHWDNESCVFDPRTGQTHVLGVFPSLLLRLIDKRPRTPAELARVVTRCSGQADEAALRGQITWTLAQLRKLRVADTADGER